MGDETANVDIVSDLNSGGDAVPVDQGVQTNAQPTKEVPVSAPEPPPSEAAKKPLSLREQISSALKGEAQTPAIAQKDGLPRNPDGTFAPKAPDAGTPPVEAPVQPVAAPQGLSAQDAELFAKLPAEMQASLARTMESLNERATRFAGYEQMEQLISPRRQAWAMNGMTEVQAINQLLALSDFAAQRPAEFISYFSQQRGIDLEEIVFGTEPVDPNIQALQQEISNLKSQLGGMTTQQQQDAHTNTVNEIVQFADEKGADGQLLRPYFSELGDGILPLIQAVMQQNPQWSRQQILQEAYDRACWSTPSVRAKLQEATNAANTAARMQEQQETAKRARNAGASIPSGVPSTEDPKALNGSKSLRDTIKAAMAASS